MNIKPLGNRILVKQLSTEEVTASGIVLPANSEKEKPNQGIVKAVGAGELIEEYGIKVGDTVVFNGYGIAEVEVTEDNGTKEKYKIVYVADDEDSQAVAIIDGNEETIDKVKTSAFSIDRSHSLSETPSEKPEFINDSPQM